MLTTAEIKRFIDDDITSERKQRAAVGQRYYEAEHDILKSRLFYFNADGELKEDTTRSNIKISHPFFTELADQLSSYLLSFEDNPIRARENVDGLQDHLDTYFDDAFWAEFSELITGAYTKGFEYLYGYVDGEDEESSRIIFQCADSMGVVEVRDQDTDDGCRYIIYWYIDRIEKGRKTIKRIEVWSDKEIYYYVQSGNGKIELDKSKKINPRPHLILTNDETGEKRGMPLGYIPFWRLDNNKKRTSGLKPIKALIDDYDLMMCGLSNNIQETNESLYVVRGFQGDNLDELQQNIKTKKIVGVDAEGGIDIQTFDIPYQARKTKADEDEKNIYRFGMGFNSSQVGDGNVTNVVIRSRYTLLDLKANKMEKRMRQLLKQILKVVLDEINRRDETDFNASDIYFDFPRNIMTNETENIQNAKLEAETRQIEVNTILNIAAEIGDEKVLEALCDIMEWDYEELKGKVKTLKAEQSTAGARAMLEGVVTDDEQTAKISSGTLSE